MLTKKEINIIKSIIRKKSGHRKCVQLVRKRCTVKRKVGKYKNGKPKYLNYNKCEKCKLESREPLDIDHIEEIGQLPYISVGIVDWTIWIHKVFCDISNLQGLCKQCHKAKTAKYNILEALL